MIEGVALLPLVLLLQAPQADAAPPPPAWKASVNAGLARASGNKDTSTLNIGFEADRDAGGRTVFHAEGLWLRGRADDEATVDRTTFKTREKYRFRDRAFVFGELYFLHDRFKAIDHLWAPTVGLGYSLVKTPVVTWDLDAGAGAQFEKNPTVEVRESGVITSGDRLAVKLSDTSKLTQTWTALWKANDFHDGLYTFGLTAVSSMTTTLQLKAEFTDTFKNRPAGAGTRKNDTTLVVGIVFKFRAD